MSGNIRAREHELSIKGKRICLHTSGIARALRTSEAPKLRAKAMTALTDGSPPQLEKRGRLVLAKPQPPPWIVK